MDDIRVPLYSIGEKIIRHKTPFIPYVVTHVESKNGDVYYTLVGLYEHCLYSQYVREGDDIEPADELYAREAAYWIAYIMRRHAVEQRDKNLFDQFST